MSNDPKACYEEVLAKLVNYCEGHPLALKLLGESLHNRDVAYWEGLIETLKKENGTPVNNVLRISFDSLPSENDKDLFKHIACFFVGTDRDVTEAILKLLQEMGKTIVREESPNKPWKRSRLWCHEESFEVLKRKKGTENVLGFTLDMRMLEKDKLCGSIEFKTDALSNMDNLMLLQLNYMKIKGTYKKFPEKLRWLCMHGFPLESIPSNLLMDNLVSLDMSYSKIKSFDVCYRFSQRPHNRLKKLFGSLSKDKSLLGSLKFLNLSFCDRLTKLGGFDRLPALESLIVRSCIGLLEVSESIGQCVELVLVDLSYCNKLKKLPGIIGMLKKTKTLLLDGCDLGEPRMLKANKKASSSTGLEAIPNDLKFFDISLPSSLVSVSLANNNLSTKSFPMDFSELSMLKELCLDDNPIKSLPNCVRSLPRLEILTMRNCKMLTSVEHPPHTLTQLFLSDGSSLQKVLFDPGIGPLSELVVPWEPVVSSFEIQGMIKIQPMEDVEENVLHRLGWNKMFILKKKGMGIEEFQIQHNLFGKKMPHRIMRRSKGPSISFTIPSSLNNLRGLNVCCVRMCELLNSRSHSIHIPETVVSNITKNRTWMYRHWDNKVIVREECVIFLSHWMFGMNEMEAGDQVTITILDWPNHVTKECGVSFVYDDGEEEDVLCYYKSWNHIIGGDLTGFQTTGEYTLEKWRILLPCHASFTRQFGSNICYTVILNLLNVSNQMDNGLTQINSSVFKLQHPSALQDQ
ncbi:disease resistance protein RPV1 [Lactuca sativa]|uniref:disease resistance protein RPV1 n=1 Tax=Lactuca sativa TaxID=4236 RepID=UPI000CD7F84B|nr:disease resistance protein RPV1 [Lactuca sativa]